MDVKSKLFFNTVFFIYRYINPRTIELRMDKITKTEQVK